MNRPVLSAEEYALAVRAKQWTARYRPLNAWMDGDAEDTELEVGGNWFVSAQNDLREISLTLSSMRNVGAQPSWLCDYLQAWKDEQIDWLANARTSARERVKQLILTLVWIEQSPPQIIRQRLEAIAGYMSSFQGSFNDLNRIRSKRQRDAVERLAAAAGIPMARSSIPSDNDSLGSMERAHITSPTEGAYEVSLRELKVYTFEAMKLHAEAWALCEQACYKHGSTADNVCLTSDQLLDWAVETGATQQKAAAELVGASPPQVTYSISGDGGLLLTPRAFSRMSDASTHISLGWNYFASLLNGGCRGNSLARLVLRHEGYVGHAGLNWHSRMTWGPLAPLLLDRTASEGWATHAESMGAVTPCDREVYLWMRICRLLPAVIAQSLSEAGRQTTMELLAQFRLSSPKAFEEPPEGHSLTHAVRQYTKGMIATERGLHEIGASPQSRGGRSAYAFYLGCGGISIDAAVKIASRTVQDFNTTSRRLAGSGN